MPAIGMNGPYVLASKADADRLATFMKPLETYAAIVAEDEVPRPHGRDGYEPDPKRPMAKQDFQRVEDDYALSFLRRHNRRVTDAADTLGARS